MGDFDIRELTLRVKGAFTAGEMRRLCVCCGSGEAEHPSDVASLARHLVRVGETRFGRTEMVRRLRLEKPLIEWPDSSDADAEAWGPKPADATPVSATIPELLSISAEPDPPSPISAKPASQEHPAASVRSPLSEPGSVAPTVIDGAPPSSAIPAGPPASGTPASAANPFVFAPPSEMAAPAPAQRRGGLDPRLVIAMGATMVVLAVIAFVAGLVWRGGDSAASAPAPSAAVSAGGTGVASRASNALDRGLLAVAETCELDVDGAPTRDILAFAQEGCGASAMRRNRPVVTRDRGRERYAPPDPDDEPDPDPRPTRPQGAGRPGDARPGKGTCMNACARVHGECRAECGPEPSDATKYDVYQACSGKCLTANSRCRLSCP